LAALAIQRPEITPLNIAEIDPSGILTACGFGPNGLFRSIAGSITGHPTAAGATFSSTTITGAVRPGDSGGGVLNPRGQIVGVVWGQRDGLTYATCGRPVREFLNRLRSHSSGVQGIAMKPQVPNQPAASVTPQLDWQAITNELEARIRALDAKKQDRGDYLQHGDLNGYLRVADGAKLTEPLAQKTEVENKLGALSSRFESVHAVVATVRDQVDQLEVDREGFLRGMSIGKVAVGALGLSGPLAAAVVIAGGLMGRRVRSRLTASKTTKNTGGNSAAKATHQSYPVAVDSPPPPQRSVPETHYVPVEKDSFAKAHQWASEHVARKYPGATEVLQAQDSLIKQFLAGR
jgi:hypothetical protein